MLEPIEIIIPEGTILNAAYPAATTYGNHLCPNNADAIIRALAPAIPERVTAGWNQLLVKIEQQPSAPTFWLRVTATSGAPLRDGRFRGRDPRR